MALDVEGLLSHHLGMPTIEDIVLDPPKIGEILDPRVLWGPQVPVELEIGSGKGGFLVRRARECPDRAFLGIEWANKFFRYAADRMARWGLTNVRLMRADARHLVIHQLAESSLCALHIYHPDPWPKQRHHKRRLFNPQFIERAVAVLQPTGRWAIQTDHAEYYEWIRALVDPVEQLVEIPYNDPEFGIIDEDAGTNFEIKYIREGRPIYRVAYQKIADRDSSLRSE